MHKCLAFRGQENQQFKLLPSIGRGHIIEQERNLIELSKYRLPNIFKSDLIPIDLLALLQHYGIPTRLLDVTSNPLVALYFAASGIQSDGEVFAFEYNDSDLTNYPIINAIAESYKFANDIDVATLLYRPIITLVACHRINRYNDMRTGKGKGFRTLIFCRVPYPETIIKNMVIISKYEVEYKKGEDIFNQQ